MHYFKDALRRLSYDEGLLEVEYPLHRFCTVTVFLPLLQEAVNDAVLTWNLHTIRAVRNGPLYRPSHIPKLAFQAEDREAGIVKPPEYPQGGDPAIDEEVDHVDDVGRDYWNHSNLSGNFEAGIRDMDDPVSYFCICRQPFLCTYFYWCFIALTLLYPLRL